MTEIGAETITVHISTHGPRVHASWSEGAFSYSSVAQFTSEGRLDTETLPTTGITSDPDDNRLDPEWKVRMMMTVMLAGLSVWRDLDPDSTWETEKREFDLQRPVFHPANLDTI